MQDEVMYLMSAFHMISDINGSSVMMDSFLTLMDNKSWSVSSFRSAFSLLSLFRYMEKHSRGLYSPL